MSNGRSSSDVFKFSILLWGLGIFVYFLISPGLFPVLLIAGRILLALGTGAIIVGGAAALGARLMRALVPEADRPERIIFGAGLGLGIISVLVLLLAHISTDLLIVVFTACAIMLFVFRKEIGFNLNLSRDGFSRCVLAVLLAVFLLNLSICFLPPLAYDVVEYHLGAPAEYIRNGSMRFLPHNVYASFPANVEMLYLLALRVGGLPFAGAAVAKVINLLLVILSTAAVYLLTRRFAGKRAGLVAAAILCTHPLVREITMRAYVESGLIFYTVLALYAAISFGESGSRRWAVMAGISAGLAAGCKYTGLPFVAVPVVLYIAIARKTPKDAAAAALCCVAAFAPWAVRNILSTGNPLYPLAYDVLGGSGWNGELNARFAKAHSPPPVAAAGWQVVEFFRRLFAFFTNAESGSPLLLIFVPIAFLMGVKRRLLLLASGYFLFYFVVWFAATHRVDRFLAAALPALCVLAGAGADAAAERLRFLKWVTTACLVMAAAFIMLVCICEETPQVVLGMKSEKEWLIARTEGASYSAEAVAHINELPEDSKVLLLGEAETYYFDRDIVYSVVFNDDFMENLVAGGPRSARAALEENGVTHIFINWSELRRLRRSYSYRYRGGLRPGYLPHMSDREIFGLFRGFDLETSWGEPDPRTGHSQWELYTVDRSKGIP